MALLDSQPQTKEEAEIEVDNRKEEEGESIPIKGGENNRVSPMLPTPATPPTQLTIFYNGSISVFDEITPEKAQAIMLIAAASAAASRTASNNKSKINMVANANVNAALAAGAAVGGFNPVVSATAVAALTRSLSQKSPLAAATAASPQAHGPASPCASSLHQLQPDLPIARRNSLQQFLEKRRNRLVSRAPYASAKKPDEGLEAGMAAKPQLT